MLLGCYCHGIAIVTYLISSSSKYETTWDHVFLLYVAILTIDVFLPAWLHGNTHTYDSSFYLAGVLFLLSGLAMVPGIYQNYVHRRRTR